MSVDLHQLIAADHETACACPPGFDPRLAVTRVKAIRRRLEKIVGCRLEMDAEIQDASFFCELALFRPASESSNVLLRVLGIRFSCFGDLVTVWSEEDSDYEETGVEPIIQALEEAGFQYVSPGLLKSPYAGSNPRLQGQGSWWKRYFDYQ